jgi:hypothetical protein
VYRILFIVTVLYVIWRVLHAWGRKIVRGSRGAEDFSRFSARRRAAGRGDGKPVPTPGDELVECACCGTFVPRARLVKGDDGRLYCSQECNAREGGAARSGVHTG